MGMLHSGLMLENPGFPALPYLDAIREMAYEGIGSATLAVPNSDISDSRKTGSGTIWDGSSILHRIAARGAPDTGVAPFAYGFAGNKTGLRYNNAWQASTSYIKWECIANGNDVFMCTSPGVTGSSLPSFNTSQTQVSTTNDGGVTWTYIGNVVNDHSGNSTDWDDTGNFTHDSYVHNLGVGQNQAAYFYDLAGTALKWREYLIDRGLGSQDDVDILDWVAGCQVDHEYERNEPNEYRNNTSTYGKINHQLSSLAAGYYMDRNASGTRYKGRGLVDSDVKMQGHALSGQYSFYNGQTVPLGTVTNVNGILGAWINPRSPEGVLLESTIREVSYSFKNMVAWKRSEWKNTGTLTWPTVTISGEITTPVPMPQFFIALILEKWHDVMNGTHDTPNGWGPFMKGLSSKVLIEYMELMIDAGLDYNSYVSSADMGGDYNGLGWSDSVAHGVCQAWPTLDAAFQDFFYWMRYTALDSLARSMWFDSLKGWRYRSEQPDSGNIFPELNGMIAPAYYYCAKMLKRGATVLPGTHSSIDNWVTDADEIWEGAVENYTWFGVGKQSLQFLSYVTDMIDIRNFATGRND